MVSNRDTKFIHLAAAQARSSPCLMKHGAVAVMNGRIVGKGYNHHRCNSKDGFIHDCVTCHAEISALREVHKRKINFKKVTLYTCRLDNNDVLQASAPCLHCMDTIRLLNIKRIVYSAGDNDIRACKPCVYQTKYLTRGQKTYYKSSNRSG